MTGHYWLSPSKLSGGPEMLSKGATEFFNFYLKEFSTD